MNTEKESLYFDIHLVTLFKIYRMNSRWNKNILSKYLNLYPLRVEIKNCADSRLLSYLSAIMGEVVTENQLRCELAWWQRKYAFVSLYDLMKCLIDEKAVCDLWRVCLIMKADKKDIFGVFIRLEGLPYGLWQDIRDSTLQETDKI